ncbi:MAG: protein-ADP-ribose hydrolase [bacterium]|nr:protein-ADP-ribose hydrolase [bacterium]
MTQEQRLEYLIQYLRSESASAYCWPDAAGFDGKRNLLRAMMNVRPPLPIEKSVLSVQDSYLRQRSKEKGIVSAAGLPRCSADPRIAIWQGDITRLNIGAIVNAANSQMLGCFVPLHSCIDNCIHTFAGMQLRTECQRKMEALRQKYGLDYEQPTAVPLLTDAYNLPAAKIIHIVGPCVRERLTPASEHDLAACYCRTLELCAAEKLRSLAFCCISTGVFGFPGARAATVAVKTVRAWLDDHPRAIDLVVFNVFKDRDKKLYADELK